MNDKKVQVWTCKIIVPEGELPNGFDFPPRSAAVRAVELAGIEVLGCSSGWGGSLTKDEAGAFADKTGDIYYAGTMDGGGGTEH